MRHLIRKLSSVALLCAIALLASCGPFVDQSEPWWLGIVPGSQSALDAALSEDEKTLWFITIENGVWSMKLRRADLTQPGMPVTEMGVLEPLPGQKLGSSTSAHVDLAVRPGSGDLYLFIDEQVVRFKGGSLSGELVRARGVGEENRGTGAGSIAFMDADTLAYANDEVVELYSLSGEAISAPTRLSTEGGETVLGPRRQLGVAGDQLWVRGESGGLFVFRKDGTLLAEKSAFRASLPLVASTTGALWINSSNPHEGYCIEPVASDGGIIDPYESGQDRPSDAVGCTNLDIPLAPSAYGATRGSSSRDGRTVVLVSPLFITVASESRPVGASPDLQGTWCPVFGRQTVVGGVQFQVDGSRLLTVPSNSLDDLFATVTLEGGGDVRTVRLIDPDPLIADNVVVNAYDYFFKRTGDTLIVHGPVTREQAESRNRSGYLNRSGLYVRSVDGTCISSGL